MTAEFELLYYSYKVLTTKCSKFYATPAGSRKTAPHFV